MPQRKKNYDHDENHRARGGRRGANGRGRGEPSHARRGRIPTPLATRTTRRPYPHANTEIDAVIQQWVDPLTDPVPGATGNGITNNGRSPWNGTQRARPGETLSRGTASPRRPWGASTPRGRGRGRGRPEDPRDSPFVRRARFGVGGRTPLIGKGVTLSDLLYAERPLLRPVKFVRATLTPFLFQRPEDVLMPAVDVAEASHVPTADRVAQLFQGAETSESDSEPENRDEDALEEVDFADLGQIRAAVDAIAQDAATASMNQDVHEDEDMKEVDSADLGAIRDMVDASPPRTSSRDDIVQETFTGVFKQSKDAMRVSNSRAVGNGVQQTPPTLSSSMNESTHDQDAISFGQESNGPYDVPIIEPSPSPLPSPDPTPRFFVDTTPTRPRGASDVILVDRTGHDYALGNDLDDELIVYVAPHPRSRRSPSPISPPMPRVKLPQTSMLTGQRVAARPEVEVEVEMRTDGSRSPVLREDDDEGAALSLAPLRIESEPESGLADVPRVRPAKAARRVRQKDAVRKWTRQRRVKRRGQGFEAYGAIMSEMMVREDERERRRARWETRRRGDSDLDWGTEMDEVDAASDGGMEVDADVDVTAMQGFVESMDAEGSRFVTADDIDDDSSMLDENSDDDDDDEDEDEEEEEVFDAEEQRLIAESEGELSSDDDDDLSPRSSFQARLHKIRQQSRGRRPTAAASETSDEDDEDAPEVLPRTHGAKDEDLFAHIQDLLEENSRILPDRGHTRGADEWDVERYLDDQEYTTPVKEKRAQRKKKGKGKQQPQSQTEQDSDAEKLQAMWKRDRAKKAAYKRARYEARLRAALDPLAGPLSSKGKGKGKAPRKAMRAAARLDPETALGLAPRAIVDATSLEAQLRRFASAGGSRGPRSVALPPMDKSARKMVHEMAAAFGIRSVSKGQGDGRYATLVRTPTTGVGVREARVRAIVKRYGWVGRGGGAEGKREGKGRGAPKHREGDEVGKEAPKIGAGNVGFKMLASMGWSEGDRIGLTGSAGLEAPLTAIIKRSKLGLGATRERE